MRRCAPCALALLVCACSADGSAVVSPVPPSTSSAPPSPTEPAGTLPAPVSSVATTVPVVASTSTIEAITTTTVATTTTTTTVPAVLPPDRLVDHAGLANRPGGGFWTVDQRGLVTAVAPARSFGDLTGTRPAAAIVAIEATPSGEGYWLLGADGGVFTFGDARFAGTGPTLSVAMSATPLGEGYWITDTAGHVQAFGDAVLIGDLGETVPAAPVVAMAATPSGGGYWLVAADGAVFTFGDAPFHGAGAPVPVVAMVPVLGGYALVSGDGTVTSFGATIDLGPSPLELGTSGLAAVGGPLAIGVGASMALGYVEPPLLPVPPPPSPGDEVIYLTYDDGPDPSWTPQILDLLAAHGAKATFCQIGSAVERHQDLAARTVAEGHGLCNHTWTHGRLSQMDETQYRDEIGRTAGVQVLATGGRGRCVRPPYGAIDQEARDWIASSEMTLAMWTIDTSDWKRPGVHAIANEVLRQVRGGSVILLHDGGDRRAQTVAATEILLHRLRLAGYLFEPLPDCGPLTSEPPTVPTTTTTTLSAP